MKKDKHCTICGKLLFLPTGNQKYCMDCAIKTKGRGRKVAILKRKLQRAAGRGRSFEELEMKARELGLSYGKYMGLRRLGKI